MVNIIIREKSLHKIKGNSSFYYRNKVPFVKKKTIKNSISKLYNIRPKFNEFKIIYKKSIKTEVCFINNTISCCIEYKDHKQIQFFIKDAILIRCPILQSCRKKRFKKITVDGTTYECCSKNENTIDRCTDIQFLYIEEPVYPSKVCISEAFAVMNLCNILVNKKTNTKDKPDREYGTREYTDDYNVEGIYIRHSETKYTDYRSPLKNKGTPKKPHYRIGHWRYYKDKKAVWIKPIQIKGGVQKPYIL